MKIQHEDLVDLLAGAMGSDKKEASRALSEWVAEVVKAIEEKGVYKAAGLGAFLKKEGKLEFQPDETLSLEVNHKFVGMSPIEVSPSQSRSTEASDKKRDEEGDTEISEEPPWTPDDKEGVEDELEKKITAPDYTSEEEESEKKEKEEETPDVRDDELTEDFDEELFEKPEKDENPEISYKPGDIRPVEVARSSGHGGGGDRTRKDQRQEGSFSDKLVWLVPVAAILIAAILLFFHFDGLRLDRKHSEGPAVVQEQIPVPVPDEEEEETGVAHEIAPSPDPVDDVSIETDHELPPDPVLDGGTVPVDEVISDLVFPYGLKGPEDEVLIGSYTIVLHSVRNERKSEIEKKKLEDRGFKATRWSAEHPGGGTTWRVGVGQFKNVSDAKQAVDELPEPYRSNNFIIRIR